MGASAPLQHLAELTELGRARLQVPPPADQLQPPQCGIAAETR
jgi:hypothetical protein